MTLVLLASMALVLEAGMRWSVLPFLPFE